ncbi:hypothetical protein C0J52_00626 [Blattella germanica]|nr:hypothetical protein C0J52_00626 [Blattella germanica]
MSCDEGKWGLAARHLPRRPRRNHVRRRMRRVLCCAVGSRARALAVRGPNLQRQLVVMVIVMWWCCLVLLAPALAFNLNWNHARLFSDGGQGSYFGFTVDFQKDGPILNKMKGIVEPGVVYHCDVDQGTSCSLLKLDVSGNVPLSAIKVIHKKDRGWFGGSMAIADNLKRTVVSIIRKILIKMCNSYHRGHYLMNGICYQSDDPNYNPRTNLLMPLVNQSMQSYTHRERNDKVFNYAYGEAGFTAHFPKDSKDLILGAPGVFDWKGAIIRYKPGPNSRYEKAEIPSTHHTKGLYDNNYLGYSLSSGKFFRNDPKTYYVSGAPRASDYKGQVLFFEFPDDLAQGLVIKLIREGTQMGEYFGGALCVADVNGDGLDDLIVGAPQHSLRTQNAAQSLGDEGRIYVYVNDDKGMTEVTANTHIMGRRKHGARFGTAIANIGDLNFDGFEDVAVGAFESGHAVLLRAHPIITFHSSLSADVKRIVEKTKSFVVRACLAYSGAYAPESVESTWSLKVDSTTNYGRGIIASNGQSSIDDVKDPSKPIDILMNYDLKYNPADQKPNPNPGGKDGFCRDCPVVDIFHSKSRTLRVPFETGCKTDVCSPDLSVNVKFTDVQDEGLILGVQQTLEMVVEILNKGDPAYLPELEIVIPNETPLTRYPQNCKSLPKEDSVDNHTLKCDVGNSLIKNSTIRLQMDMKDVSVRETQLVFSVNASSSGDEATPGDNYKRVALNLLVRSDMTITGVSSREQIVYISQNNTIMKDLRVNYTFEVSLKNTFLIKIKIQGPWKCHHLALLFVFFFFARSGTLDQAKWRPPTSISCSPLSTRTGQSGTRSSTFTNQSCFSTLLQSTLTYNQNAAPIECRINQFSFFQKNRTDEDILVPIPFENEPEETLPDHHLNSTARRAKRSTDPEDTPYFKMTDQTPVNKTFFFNCGDPNVDCARVECDAGPFFASKSRATIVFPLELKNLEFIGELATKEIMLFSAKGQVRVDYKLDGNRDDEAIVQTMLLGKVNVSDGGVPSWIIAVAIICGLLLFCLLAMLLHKASLTTSLLLKVAQKIQDGFLQEEQEGRARSPERGRSRSRCRRMKCPSATTDATAQTRPRQQYYLHWNSMKSVVQSEFGMISSNASHSNE